MRPASVSLRASSSCGSNIDRTRSISRSIPWTSSARRSRREGCNRSCRSVLGIASAQYGLDRHSDLQCKSCPERQVVLFSRILQPDRADRRFGGAVVLLRCVAHLVGREIERDVLGKSVLATSAAGGERADDHVLQVEFQVLDRLFTAGLPAGQRRLIELLARDHRLSEVGRGLVDPFGDSEVVDIGLAGAAASGDVHRARLGSAPAPG